MRIIELAPAAGGGYRRWNLNRARTVSQRKYSTWNMTLFQIQLLAVIRLDVNVATHIVNLYGVIVQTKQLKLGIRRLANERLQEID